VFDGDTHALSGLETGGLDPSSGELHPRKGGRFLAHMEGQACRFLIAPGFLDGDRAFGDPRGLQAIPVSAPPPLAVPSCGPGSRDVPKWFQDLIDGVTFNRPKNPPDGGPVNGWIEGPRRGREYGLDGLPQRDYDKPHQGNEVDHVHEWPGGRARSRGVLTRRGPENHDGRERIYD
jgi:hypothetical protein